MKIKQRPAAASAPISKPVHTRKASTTFHEAECAWVPGTTDRIRFTLLRPGNKVKAQVRELAAARLAVMFGRTLMDDLYLRGRARLRLSDHQLLELA